MDRSNKEEQKISIGVVKLMGHQKRSDHEPNMSEITSYQQPEKLACRCDEAIKA
jgi:hypothetical protein